MAFQPRGPGCSCSMARTAPSPSRPVCHMRAPARSAGPLWRRSRRARLHARSRCCPRVGNHPRQRPSRRDQCSVRQLHVRAGSNRDNRGLHRAPRSGAFWCPPDRARQIAAASRIDLVPARSTWLRSAIRPHQRPRRHGVLVALAAHCIRRLTQVTSINAPRRASQLTITTGIATSPTTHPIPR